MQFLNFYRKKRKACFYWLLDKFELYKGWNYYYFIIILLQISQRNGINFPNEVYIQSSLKKLF